MPRLARGKPGGPVTLPPPASRGPGRARRTHTARRARVRFGIVELPLERDGRRKRGSIARRRVEEIWPAQLRRLEPRRRSPRTSARIRWRPPAFLDQPKYGQRPRSSALPALRGVVRVPCGRAHSLPHLPGDDGALRLLLVRVRGLAPLPPQRAPHVPGDVRVPALHDTGRFTQRGRGFPSSRETGLHARSALRPRRDGRTSPGRRDACGLASLNSLGSHGLLVARGSIPRLSCSLSALREACSPAPLARLAFDGWPAPVERGS